MNHSHQRQVAGAKAQENVREPQHRRLLRGNSRCGGHRKQKQYSTSSRPRKMSQKPELHVARNRVHSKASKWATVDKQKHCTLLGRAEQRETSLKFTASEVMPSELCTRHHHERPTHCCHKLVQKLHWLLQCSVKLNGVCRHCKAACFNS